MSWWLERLEPKAYLPLVITHATLSGSGLLSVLLRKLGQPASLIRSRNLARLEDALKELGRLTPTLVLDEAQLYPPGALDEMRLLLGLNLARQPTFALVLVGDLYLQDTLRLQQHKALYSRISAHCQLPLLERAQIEPYLDPRLAPGRIGTSLPERGGLGLAGGRQQRQSTPAQSPGPRRLDRRRPSRRQHDRPRAGANRTGFGSGRTRQNQPLINLTHETGPFRSWRNFKPPMTWWPTSWARPRSFTTSIWTRPCWSWFWR